MIVRRLLGLEDALSMGICGPTHDWRSWITLVPHTQRLTTQEAADFLGVSRPTLVKLLKEGKIPFDQPGRHRRILFADLLDYRERQGARRRGILDQMTREASEAGLYDIPHEDYLAAAKEARKRIAREARNQATQEDSPLDAPVHGRAFADEIGRLLTVPVGSSARRIRIPRTRYSRGRHSGFRAAGEFGNEG